MSLQNAIWALAASGHTKYDRYAEIFYKRACKYLEADEMKVRRSVQPNGSMQSPNGNT